MCTNPTAFVKTLESINSPVILIAGGKNKLSSRSPVMLCCYHQGLRVSICFAISHIGVKYFVMRYIR